MTCFTTIQSFLEFLASHPNTVCKTEHSDMPCDVSVADYLALDRLELRFGHYAQNPLVLKFSQETHELFLGDMNEGGHAVRCRLVKVTREDILHNSREMLTWLENHAEKMWL